jgi:hypothetical protein
VLDAFREQVRSPPCPRLEQLQYPQRRRAAARIDRAESLEFRRRISLTVAIKVAGRDDRPYPIG